MQAAPGTVFAVSVASVNGATGVVRLTSSTPTSIAPAAVKQRKTMAVVTADLSRFTRGPVGTGGSHNHRTGGPARLLARQVARQWEKARPQSPQMRRWASGG